MMLYVERLQNEKRNATGAEKNKLDLKVVEINIPDEDVKVAGFQRALQNIQVLLRNLTLDWDRILRNQFNAL